MASMDVDQDQPKKRLMIRQMVLENFKSYAGAQHVGPFHKVCNRLPSVRAYPGTAVAADLSAHGSFKPGKRCASFWFAHYQRNRLHLLHLLLCSASQQLWGLMAVASPMSLTPCCLCSGEGPNRSVLFQASAMTCHHSEQQWAFKLQATGTQQAWQRLTQTHCAQQQHSSAELVQHLEACVICLTAVALQQGC
jgi:hypothetical protein